MLNLDPPIFDLSSKSATLFLLSFVLVSIIGVLNILIAQVGSILISSVNQHWLLFLIHFELLLQLNETYSRIEHLTHSYATLHRARIAVEIESYMPLRWISVLMLKTLSLNDMKMNDAFAFSQRRLLWSSMSFDEPVEFEAGYKVTKTWNDFFPLLLLSKVLLKLRRVQLAAYRFLSQFLCYTMSSIKQVEFCVRFDYSNFDMFYASDDTKLMSR